MPVSLQQQLATPFSVAQASPIQNNALSENPNVMYALDDQGNRLFPYALTPEMDKSLLPLLSETVNRACRSQLGRDTLRQASEWGILSCFTPKMTVAAVFITISTVRFV